MRKPTHLNTVFAGTPAGLMENQIPENVKSERYKSYKPPSITTKSAFNASTVEKLSPSY